MKHPRFLVDINVARLAKWLRIMGYDSLVLPDCKDSELVQAALREGRILLTRDSLILRRRVVTQGQLRVLFIRHQDLRNQLRQVIQEFSLDSMWEFSLCIQCNWPLEKIPKERAMERVPPYVFRTQEEFRVCPRCSRIYWRGTHWRNMKAELSKVRDG